MAGMIEALYRYPIKGFTPEPLATVALTAGEALPCDRLFAVENSPSGFDPEAPVHIPKRRFAALAHITAVASVRTRYNEGSGRLSAEAPGRPGFAGLVGEEEDRLAFAAWLAPILGDEAAGPLRLIDGRGHRFLDDPAGDISILNLASVRDLERRLDRPVDPLRFRANIHVEGWSPWAENDLGGQTLRLGEAEALVLDPIRRCAATEVDPATAVRDLDITGALHRLYGHVWCGIYVRVAKSGSLEIGDPVIPV